MCGKISKTADRLYCDCTILYMWNHYKLISSHKTMVLKRLRLLKPCSSSIGNKVSVLCGIMATMVLPSIIGNWYDDSFRLQCQMDNVLFWFLFQDEIKKIKCRSFLSQVKFCLLMMWLYHHLVHDFSNTTQHKIIALFLWEKCEDRIFTKKTSIWSLISGLRYWC